jgi:hypothetical protein
MYVVEFDWYVRGIKAYIDITGHVSGFSAKRRKPRVRSFDDAS